MKRIAVFPGSFDPFTVGHENLVLRGLEVFDEIVISIGVNSQKKGLFPIEKRVQMIESAFEHHSAVRVTSFEGLTVDHCKAENARYILRGLRNGRDLDFEQAIAQMNRELNAEIETVFLVNKPEYSAINSSIVREIYINKGDISAFLPENTKFD